MPSIVWGPGRGGGRGLRPLRQAIRRKAADRGRSRAQQADGGSPCTRGGCAVGHSCAVEEEGGRRRSSKQEPPLLVLAAATDKGGTDRHHPFCHRQQSLRAAASSAPPVPLLSYVGLARFAVAVVVRMMSAADRAGSWV